MWKRIKTDLPRLLLQTLFIWIYARYLGRAFVDWGFFLAGILTAYTAAVLLSRLKLRIPVALLIAFILPWLLRLIIHGILKIVRIIWPETLFSVITFDHNFFFLLGPFLIFLTSSYFTERYPAYRRWEGLLYAVILLALSLSRDKIAEEFTLQGLFTASFIVGITALSLQMLLFLPSHEKQTSSGKTSAKKAGRQIPFLILLLLLLGILTRLILSLQSQLSLSSGAGLMETGLFQFDFSDFVRLENEISMSDDLVLLFRKEGYAEKIYLRRFVLSGYSNRKGFYRDEKRDGRYPSSLPDGPLIFEDSGYAERETINQEYFLINVAGTTFLGMNEPISVTPQVSWDESSFKRIYKVSSLVSEASIIDFLYIDEPELSAEELDYYTDYGSNEAIADLAAEVTDGLSNYYAKVIAIQDHLKNNYLYSLRPGTAPDGDQLSHFLFSSKKGYCSYYAFAMTLMCRSQGIPARVAVGFWADPQSEVLNFYPILANQAHAWVEVYFNEYGWIEFDPTSETLAPGEEITFSTVSPDEFALYIEEILENQSLLSDVVLQEEIQESRKTVFRQVWTSIKQQPKRWALSLIILYLLIVMISRHIFLAIAVVQRNPARRIQSLYKHDRNRLVRMGYVRRFDETARDWAERLNREEWTLWTDWALKAAFSPAFGPQDLKKALRQRRSALKTTIKLPFLQQIRAVFYPFPGPFQGGRL